MGMHACSGLALTHETAGTGPMAPSGVSRMGWTRSVVVRGALLLVGLGVHEPVQLRGVAQPQLDHPAVTKGVLVHLQRPRTPWLSSALVRRKPSTFAHGFGFCRAGTGCGAMQVRK